ncbi:MAG: HEAT repeat domain-containing protein [Leptospira sp.]|nr:HEAT repeat domain-containing protein [Leptospira sp.]
MRLVFLSTKIFSILLMGALWLQCSTPSKRLSLSDISPRFSDFENSDLDPLKTKSAEIPSTGMPKYDGFFTQAHKTITTLKLGENVAESAFNKQQSQQSIEKEMEAALYLEDELPSLIAGLPILEATGRDIQQNIESDFTGSNRAMLPSVGMELANVMKDLAEYTAKAPKIYSEIQRLRTDADNFSSGAGSRTTDDSNTQRNDSEELDEDSSDKKEDPENQNTTKPERTIAGQSITPEIRRIPGGYSPDALRAKAKTTEKLSEEELAAREYDKKLKDGLLAVFRAETNRNVKQLSNLTLKHPIPRVRAAGAYALGRLKLGRWTIEHSIKNDGFVVRPAAYKALSDHGHKASLPLFIAGSKSDDNDIQAYSFLGMGKTKDPVGRELILGYGLTSSEPKIVSHSLLGLAHYSVPADLELIKKYLGSDNSELSNSAVEALTIHNTPESLLVLENALVDHPKLAMEILDAIGKSSELAATFFLVRASQLYEDEKILTKIGRILLKRKAFGTYGMVVVKEDRIRSQFNERANAQGIVRLSDVGRLNSSSPKRYVVRVGENLLEDVYHNMTFENRILGSKNRYVRGWIFGKKIQLIQIKKPTHKDPAKLENLQTGKFQNLYDPVD